MVIHVCCQWHVFPATRLGACLGGGGVSGYIRLNLLIIVAICAQLPLGAALNHC